MRIMKLERCLSVIVLVTIITTIVQTKSVGNVPLQIPNAIVVTAISKNASTTPHNDMKDMLSILRSKYQHTLLNDTILPFLKNCSFVYTATMAPTTTQPSLPSSPLSAMVKPDLLCLVYFDMVHNLGESGFSDYQTVASVFDTLKAYDNESMVGNFCALFAGEIPIEPERRPFETKILPNKKSSWEIFKAPNACNLLCYELDAATFQSHIKPSCKLISGGYSALHRHLIDHDKVPEQSQKPTITKIADGPAPVPLAVSVVNGVAQIPLDPQVAKVQAPAPVVAPVEAQKPLSGIPKILEPIEAAAINAAAELPAPVASAKPVLSVAVPVSVKAPSTLVGPTPSTNLTVDNAALPISNDKVTTKEMKVTQKELEPAVEQGEAEEEAESPVDTDGNDYDEDGNDFYMSINSNHNCLK